MFHVEHAHMLGEWLQEGAESLGITLHWNQVESFILYLSELKRWNEKTNLTAIKDDQEIIAKHFLDSIACAKALDGFDGKTLLDVGAGAGFPGIPLKILHPNLKVYMVEPSQKKTAFLRHIVGTLQLHDCITIGETIENCTKNKEYSGSFGYIVTRALAIHEFVGFFNTLLVESGKLILFRAAPMESDGIGREFRVIQEMPYEIPFGHGKRVITILEKSILN